MHFLKQRRRAFTLIEVLVVVAIIALLVAILLPSLVNARDLARRTGCLAGLRSMGQAMTFYSGDHQDKYFMFNRTYNFTSGAWGAVGGTISDDSAVALALDMKSIGKIGDPGYQGPNAKGAPHKKYIRDWGILLCPATRNRITKVNDLNRNADNPDGGVALGHSYELWNGFQKGTYAPGGTTKLYSGSSGDADKDGYPDCLKRPSVVTARGAAYVILVVDGDDPTPGKPDNNNFPDYVWDNHGSKGWNMLFADMRAAWITPAQTYKTLDRSDMSVADVPEEYRR